MSSAVTQMYDMSSVLCTPLRLYVTRMPSSLQQRIHTQIPSHGVLTLGTHAAAGACNYKVQGAQQPLFYSRRHKDPKRLKNSQGKKTPLVAV
jgi:hypothetical protein